MLAKMNYLLHDENFSRIILNGKRIEKWLQIRAQRLAILTKDIKDIDVSIVIRSRNDGRHIRRLLDDIQSQIFDGKVEIIVVDTSSKDDTVAYAKSQGAKVINIKQEEFTYPKALNVGFRAAKYPWVVTLVGHSSLSNRLFLRNISYWNSQDKKLGGIYCLPLANWNASMMERWLGDVLRPSIWKKPKEIKELSIGIMGANCSVVKRNSWKQLGGYDERYAGGGEDRELAERMLANSIHIIREPLCSVFHSHGLSVANSMRQWLHWSEVAKKAVPFETAKVHKRRPDLQ